MGVVHPQTPQERDVPSKCCGWVRAKEMFVIFCNLNRSVFFFVKNKEINFQDFFCFWARRGRDLYVVFFMEKVFAESLYKKRQIPRMGHFNSSEESVFFLRVAKNLSNPSNRHGVSGSFDQSFQAGCGQIIFDYFINKITSVL